MAKGREADRRAAKTNGDGGDTNVEPQYGCDGIEKGNLNPDNIEGGFGDDWWGGVVSEDVLDPGGMGRDW